MNEKSRTCGNRGTTVGGMLALLMIASATPGWSNTSNGIPYSISFEGLDVGTLISGTNGWYGDVDAASVVAGDPMYVFGYVIADAHTKVLEMTAPVSNQFNTNALPGQTNVWIDLMVKPVPRDVPPSGLDTNIQTAIYLGTDGCLRVMHQYRTSPWSPTPYWTKLNHPPIATNTWFRLTIKMDYRTDAWFQTEENNQFDTYFQVSINGGEPQSAPMALLQPMLGSGGTGTWFLCANAHENDGLVPTYLSAISTEGPGMLDDIVVTNQPVPTVSGSTYGIDNQIYVSNGIWDPDGDSDGDTNKNWEEMVAGSNPFAADGMLTVVQATSDPTSATIKFLGTDLFVTNSYTMLRATNLMENSPWIPVATVARDPSGTNTWTDLNAPAGRAYYRPTIQWVY